MKPPQHIAEVDQYLDNEDWQMRKRFTLDVFAETIEDPEFLEFYKGWLAGDSTLPKPAAVIDVKDDNPFAYVIIDHKNRTVGGLDWHDRILRKYENRWQIHMDELAMEYRDAKNDGPQCHTIEQCIDGLERRYCRLIIPKGDELLVFSSTFTPKKEMH